MLIPDCLGEYKFYLIAKRKKKCIIMYILKVNIIDYIDIIELCLNR